jgi:hypothetical protein
VAVEDDAEQIRYLALEPVRGRPDTADRADVCVATGQPDLEADAGAALEGDEDVDDLEPRIARPEIDRVGSAWLIRKLVDPKAKFLFGSKRPPNRRVLTFDMLGGDFSHDGDNCTFETLIRRFAISDKAVAKIGEMIHVADLDDARFQRVEARD